MHDLRGNSSHKVVTQAIQGDCSEHAKLDLPGLNVLESMPHTNGSWVDTHNIVIVVVRNMIIASHNVFVIREIESGITFVLAVVPWDLCPGVVHISEVHIVLVWDGTNLLEGRLLSIKQCLLRISPVIDIGPLYHVDTEVSRYLTPVLFVLLTHSNFHWDLTPQALVDENRKGDTHSQEYDTNNNSYATTDGILLSLC